MKIFTKGELISVFLTLIFIAGITSFNLVKSIRRARDAQRKVDIGIVSNALHEFQADYGFFPRSENGNIVICKNDKFNEVRKELSETKKLDFDVLNEGLRSCTWGVDPFQDIFDDNGEPYMTTFPSDPKTFDGLTYHYISNGNRFQLYIYLEGKNEEVGYDEGIVGRNLSCGNRSVCSFGKSYGSTPLDRSIEEYEEELLRSQNN